jgi:WNK lysine deficient protein kinase
MLGTPEYMAPEVFDERYGPRADVYSFGMCVLEMCTGTTPYSECNNPGTVYRKISEGVKPDSFFRLDNDEIRDFIALCLLPES